MAAVYSFLLCQTANQYLGNHTKDTLGLTQLCIPDILQSETAAYRSNLPIYNSEIGLIDTSLMKIDFHASASSLHMRDNGTTTYRNRMEYNRIE